MPTTHGRSASPSRSQWTALTTGQVPIVGLLLVHQRTCRFEKGCGFPAPDVTSAGRSDLYNPLVSGIARASDLCPGANQRPGSESLLKLAYQTATRETLTANSQLANTPAYV